VVEKARIRADHRVAEELRHVPDGAIHELALFVIGS
jgi:hypothetical protein